MRDQLHEIAIRAALNLFLCAYRLQRWAGDQHKRLIASRSAKQVARMERRAGLL